MLATVPIVITNRRVLFFRVQRGELAQVEEHPRKDVEVVKYRTGRWRGGEDHVDWFVLRIGGQTMKFTFSDRWTDRGAMAVRALGYRGPTHHGWEPH